MNKLIIVNQHHTNVPSFDHSSKEGSRAVDPLIVHIGEKECIVFVELEKRLLEEFRGLLKYYMSSSLIQLLFWKSNPTQEALANLFVHQVSRLKWHTLESSKEYIFRKNLLNKALFNAGKMEQSISKTQNFGFVWEYYWNDFNQTEKKLWAFREAALFEMLISDKFGKRFLEQSRNFLSSLGEMKETTSTTFILTDPFLPGELASYQRKGLGSYTISQDFVYELRRVVANQTYNIRTIREYFVNMLSYDYREV